MSEVSKEARTSDQGGQMIWVREREVGVQVI